MQRNFKYYTLGLITPLLLFCSGCGVAQTGRPLGHHAKDATNRAFAPESVTWQVDNGEGLKMSREEGYLYLQFDHSQIDTANYPNTQFIIDVDDNTSTGNRQENGAEYIVENGYLYHAGKPDIWDWEEIGKVESAVDANIDTVRIPLDNLAGIRPTFSVNAEQLNKKWKPVLYSPSQIDAVGNHLKTRYLPDNG